MYIPPPSTVFLVLVSDQETTIRPSVRLLSQQITSFSTSSIQLEFQDLRLERSEQRGFGGLTPSNVTIYRVFIHLPQRVNNTAFKE